MYGLRPPGRYAVKRKWHEYTRQCAAAAHEDTRLHRRIRQLRHELAAIQRKLQQAEALLAEREELVEEAALSPQPGAQGEAHGAGAEEEGEDPSAHREYDNPAAQDGGDSDEDEQELSQFF